MEFKQPELPTLVTIGVFVIGYVVLLVRRTVRDRLDLYDLVMLATVAIVPGAFVFFPAFAQRMANVVGVAFPFVVMFGLLLVVVFVFLHQMTARIHSLERRSRRLIQDLGLLRQELDEGWGSWLPPTEFRGEEEARD